MKFLKILLLSTVMALSVMTVEAATSCVGGVCTTSHEIIPDFSAGATIRSIQTGSWFNPSTWNLGRIPNALDIVSIEASTIVTINDLPATATSVAVAGKLRFQPDAPTQLKVGTLQVLPLGEVEMGLPGNPISASARILIADIPLDLARDPRQFGGGLVVVDGTFTAVGMGKTPFLRLVKEPLAGDTSITLESTPQGWIQGDKIFIPDSRQFSLTGAAYINQSETALVSAVSGNQVTLTAPLRFSHPGARDGNDVLEFLPHVGNLTRNVVIESENPAGTRGHTMFTERSSVNIEAVNFHNLGRTTLNPPDSTTFDAQGNVKVMAQNHIGRYPLHIHHLNGVLNGTGVPFRISGSSVDDDALVPNRKWAITVHGSHYGIIEKNVVYNAAGWGIGTEDGSESFNEFRGNFVAKVRGQWSLPKSENGHAYWFRGPNNYVEDNVAANVTAQYAGDSIGFNFYFVYLGNVCVPKFKGADMTQCTTQNGNAMPLLSFARNEAYGGGMATAFSYWWLGSVDVQPRPVAESVIKDFRAWHFSLYGAYGYPGNNITFDNFVARGRKGALSNTNEFGTGIWFSDYMQSNVKVVRSNIQNLRTGIYAPYFVRGTFTVEDSFLRNAVNVKISTPGSPGSTPNGAMMPAKLTVLRNITFQQVSGNVGAGFAQQNILMDYNLWMNSSNLIQSDKVFVYAYNGVSGDDFQVFYKQQDLNFIVPQKQGNLVGSPVAGLTNAQNWATYGIAIAGEAVDGAALQARPLINGFVRAGTVPPPPPLPILQPAPAAVQAAYMQLGQLHQLADGSPKGVTVTTVPAGLSGVEILYNGLPVEPSVGGLHKVEVTLNNASYVAQKVTAALYLEDPITVGAAPTTMSIQLDSAAKTVTVFPNVMLTLSVNITSASPVTYQWLKNGRAIAGATASTYQTTAVSGDRWAVAVTNLGGTITSGAVTIQ